MYQMRSYRWRCVPRIVARLFPVFRYLENVGERSGSFSAPVSYRVRVEVQVGDGLTSADQLFPRVALVDPRADESCGPKFR